MVLYSLKRKKIQLEIRYISQATIDQRNFMNQTIYRINDDMSKNKIENS